MAFTIASPRSAGNKLTVVYEFFDARVLGRLWFVAMSDGAQVQMMAPTFGSERAARVFERCFLEQPVSALLSTDGQLELARRIEQQLESGGSAEQSLETLMADLQSEQQRCIKTPQD